MEFGFEISELALKIVATTISIVFAFYFIARVTVTSIMATNDTEVARIKNRKQPIIMFNPGDCDCKNCQPEATEENAENEPK